MRESKETRWIHTTRKSCKLKMRNQDSSMYTVYCRKREMTSCNFEFCPIKQKGK